MKNAKLKPKNIDEFIALYPKDIRAKLESIRAMIREAAPRAEVAISYGIPAFKLNGNLIFFSAFKDHIGMYPRVKALEKELSAYAGGIGTIKFPLDEPLPLALIRRIVKHRVKENLEKKRGKRKE
jgi:uncharacterized protein YdhG (YjbR/CyaY superfamily)